jgi:hypothetical protein
VFVSQGGFGKTTLAAFAPECGLIMARGETGYLTLAAAGRVPAIDHVCVETWAELLEMLHGPLPFKHIALDALDGFVTMGAEALCARDFKGTADYQAWSRGDKAFAAEWAKLIQALDAVHRRGTGIILLTHCLVKTYKNPLGNDFDRFVANLPDAVWQQCYNWADSVIFGRFRSIADDQTTKDQRYRGIGGTDRVIHTNRHDAWDAKPRLPMPSEIEIPNSEDLSIMWRTVAQYL